MSLVLTVIMVLSLAGCGKSTELSSVSRDPATDGFSAMIVFMLITFL